MHVADTSLCRHSPPLSSILVELWGRVAVVTVKAAPAQLKHTHVVPSAMPAADIKTGRRPGDPAIGSQTSGAAPSCPTALEALLLDPTSPERLRPASTSFQVIGSPRH